MEEVCNINVNIPSNTLWKKCVILTLILAIKMRAKLSSRAFLNYCRLFKIV